MTSTGMPRPSVDDGDRVVRVEAHLDVVVVPAERLVDGVVDDLVDEVVEAARAGRADVHARPQADRLEALEDGDVLCGVGWFGHQKSPAIAALAGRWQCTRSQRSDAARARLAAAARRDELAQLRVGDPGGERGGLGRLLGSGLGPRPERPVLRAPEAAPAAARRRSEALPARARASPRASASSSCGARWVSSNAQVADSVATWSVPSRPSRAGQACRRCPRRPRAATRRRPRPSRPRRPTRRSSRSTSGPIGSISAPPPAPGTPRRAVPA